MLFYGTVYLYYKNRDVTKRSLIGRQRGLTCTHHVTQLLCYVDQVYLRSVGAICILICLKAASVVISILF